MRMQPCKRRGAGKDQKQPQQRIVFEQEKRRGIVQRHAGQPEQGAKYPGQLPGPGAGKQRPAHPDEKQRVRMLEQAGQAREDWAVLAMTGE